METNKLKKYAADARINLMDGVRRKLRLLGFDEKGRVDGKEPELVEGGTLCNGEEYPESFYQQWTTLRDRLRERGVREVVEEAAYTWFNRMMAIRILTKNDLCEPILRFDPATGLPLLLADARMGRVPEMSAQERVRFDKLMDDDNRTYDQFALLLTVWCHANPIISSCFGSINDYVELLLPDNILRPDGFIAKLNDTPFITEDDYHSAELIGWLYQFYISDRKDEVMKKNQYAPSEIPAATQIFTPNWIVKYMVENTILPQVDADEEILESAKYLVKTENPVARKVDLEDLKVADFACGSGHILNEGFDLLFALYRAESYSRREAIECIFTKNLTGIDIDLRAKQLATFALLLKACQLDASFADAHCMPHVITVPELTSILKTSKYEDEDGGHGKAIKYDFFQNSVKQDVAVELDNALRLVKDAESLGSIIKFDLSPSAVRAIKETSEYWRGKEAIDRPEFVNDLLPAVDFILTLSDSYDAIVMNPPYMNPNKDKCLKKYVEENYPSSKGDLYAVFVEVACRVLNHHGLLAMITLPSWMLLGTFERFRSLIINNYQIESLLHLGRGIFGSDMGSVAFVISNSVPNHEGYYRKLFNKHVEVRSVQKIESLFFEYNYGRYFASQKKFLDIPGNPISYWVTDDHRLQFKKEPFSKYFRARHGLLTGHDEDMLRLWYEIDFSLVSVNSQSQVDFNKTGLKYVPLFKGGPYKKWYGNMEIMTKFDKDTLCYMQKYPNFVLKSKDEYFKEGLNWTLELSRGNLNVRYLPQGYLFSNRGPAIFSLCDTSLYALLGFLVSPVAGYYLRILGSSLSISAGTFESIPVLNRDKWNEEIPIQCVSISKQDWDAHETSWDFQTNPLVFSVYDNGWGKLEDSVADYEQVWEQRFRHLHANEEELNRQFIEIYGLQDELTPNVPLDEVTILQQGEVKIEEGELKWQRNVIIQQLISYIIGCYMGRYRLDRVHENGLHIAHPDPTEEELSPYQVSFTHDATFTIDSDGIIPILPQGAPFYDNLYNYVEQFVKMVWEEEDLQENMNFIEKCLGKPLNDYLMKDFWKYHKKMYQNRPIYWEFASKKGAFRALVYAHRMDRFTVEVLRSKYLLPYIAYIEKKIANMESRVAELSTTERRELDALRDKTLPELREYADRVEVVALKNITFDLDDGIIKNHALFGDIVSKLK